MHVDESDLSRIVGQLQRGGWAARELPDLKRIEVDPRRLSGRPVIRGTRVPVELVAQLAQTARGRETIRDGYDLSDDDADDALRWWRATQEFETAAA